MKKITREKIRKEKLTALDVGRLRTSFKGVNHLVGQSGSTTFSVCYFPQSGSYRVFYPYPGPNQ